MKIRLWKSKPFNRLLDRSVGNSGEENYTNIIEGLNNTEKSAFTQLIKLQGA